VSSFWPTWILRFRRASIVAAQLALMAFSYWAAFQLRFDSHLPDWAFSAMIATLPWLVLIRATTFLPFRLYEGLWKYSSVYDMQMLLAGIATSSVVFAIFCLLAHYPMPRSILIIDTLIVSMLLGGIRMLRRFLAEFGSSRAGNATRILIYGAGDAGQMIVREMRQRAVGLEPIGFVDDDPAKVGRRIHGIRVLGGRNDLPDLIAELEPSEILLALPGVAPATIRAIVDEIQLYKVPIKTLPALKDIIGGKVGVEQIRTLKVEDLLARPPIGLDTKPVRQLIHGHRVLITGAGGSIGSELCRQVAAFKPASMVLFERYENSLHAIRLELEDAYKTASKGAGIEIHAVVGDVTDEAMVTSTFEKFRPETVFHAAAHKHVTLMEENPCEAVKNNVRGTRVLAEVSEKTGVDRFIMISTDKAANPTSIMGASKSIAEQVVRAQGQGSGTSFSVVRFGNVLGSNGSVVPRFLDQIQRGGPVTVTHPDVRRFFMLIPEAVQLVLHAAAEARSGATYVLDMGEQIKVVDMARNLIRLSGKTPDEDIKIVFTGLRPGEKMEEELVGDIETMVPTGVPKIFAVYAQPSPTAAHFAETVRELEGFAAAGRSADVVRTLRALTNAPVQENAPLLHGQAPPPHPTFTSHAAHTQNCPVCSAEVHRSKARRLDQHIRKRLTTRRLFRCSSCGWRGWMDPIERAGAPVPGAVQSLDLRALDSASAQPAEPRRSFSPKDLR